MSEQKLRKFKLIDKVGYVNAHPINKKLLLKYLDDNECFVGVISDFRLCLIVKDSGVGLISKGEFKFFEEIDDTIDQDQVTYPEIGNECEYTAMNSNVWHKCTFIGIVNDLVYVDAPHLECVQKFQLNHIHFRPAKPKSWQDILCEEYNIELDKHNWTFGVSRKFTESKLIRFAKRIIELSNKH